MTASDDADAAPRPLTSLDRRAIALTIALIIVAGYFLWQIIGLATEKDAVPPAWLITAPAGSTIVGEPLVDRESYRATTYVTLRPADGQTPARLLQEMGLLDQPTQIGPSPLEWRTVWVYGRTTSEGNLEIRLVYRPDT